MKIPIYRERENSNLTSLFQEKEKFSKETIILTPNSNNTVQPVALMRLGVFVPTLKSLKNVKNKTFTTIDATEELTRLYLAKAEGFEKVEIVGPRLDMDNDFKTWIGIIHSFSKYQNKIIGDKVQLPFIDFAKLCGIPSSRLSKKLRERISPSLKRIASTTISFTSNIDEYSKEYITHLVQSAYYDTKKDIVILQADPKLFELYKFDRKVLLQLKAINVLKRRESAQALYTYIESLPKNPVPISLVRLRKRLNLRSPVFSQNQTVRRAMTQLKDIGYLDYSEVHKGNTVYFHIHYRHPKLTFPKNIKINNLQLSDCIAKLERMNLQFQEKIYLFNKLGISIEDLKNLLKLN
ncbi:RepB family plasmid replication initiator protein [Pantoea sp. Aalb]|uniref:RepB family plasmid replication initiator protein n=1 Tax=Pantoea sp. Aalb TaxID=2576762 RepID=UPI00132A3D8E|nr:RepB family plasmid replication initiator protein [Pantoea sp. Aalb]MXP68007.1 RepB family plasmid replication initiator protein [Pantoea sp. Aalb]